MSETTQILAVSKINTVTK